LTQEKSLDELGQIHKTDKRGGAEGCHDFLRKYEFFLAPLRHQKFTLLELGVFKGASLNLWADYFTQAEIVGVDIEESALAYRGERKKVILGDISITGTLESLIPLGPRVIIDDASHWWPDQLRALFILYPALMSGGLYIMEDIHTSFEPLANLFRAGLNVPPFSILLKIAEYMTGNERPAPIVKDKKLMPLSPARDFPDEIRYLADRTDSITFIERSCIMARK
jgi:hypothetical protein